MQLIKLKKESNGINFSPPSYEQIEISLFGPGYGECILIHTGNNNWIIVDSCIDNYSQQPASLQYLDKLGIDPSRHVKLVIATHWHDDHIGGLSEVLERCSSAKFVCSEALQPDDFLLLTKLYNFNPNKKLKSGIDEFKKIIDILSERKLDPIWAIENRSLDNYIEDCSCKIISLSPSDHSIRVTQAEIAQLIPVHLKPKRRIISKNLNFTSVVLLFQFANWNALLVSDLENTSDKRSGWSVVVDQIKNNYNKSAFFKIPHHGSVNSYLESVWTETLISNPLAILTPFILGRTVLPDRNDIQRILSHTSNAFISSHPFRRKTIRKERAVEKTLKEMGAVLSPLNMDLGQIRYRINLNNSDDDEITLFDPAMPMGAIKSSVI